MANNRKTVTATAINMTGLPGAVRPGPALKG